MLSRLRAAVLPLICCIVLGPGISVLTAQDASSTPTLHVDTKLVIVPVIVRDKKGQLVKTLRKEDFTIAENNKPQPIKTFDRDSEAPLTVGLLVDVSGSVRDELDQERAASSAFLDTLLRPKQDKAFIVQFAHQADLLADVTSSLPKLEAGLKHLDPDSGRPQFSGNDPGGTADNSNDQQGNGSGGRHTGRGGAGGGGTVLYDAIFLSADEVLHKETNRKALILLTDGDDRGSKESISSAIEAAQRANATVYAVYYKGQDGGGGFPGGGHRGGGFPGGGGGWPGGGGGWPGGGGRGGGTSGPGRRGEERHDGKKILERICGETGGRVFEVTKKQPIDDIYKQISDELRSEYLLGFTPIDASDGYHRIDVDLPNDKRDILQARDGYYVGASQ